LHDLRQRAACRAARGHHSLEGSGQPPEGPAGSASVARDVEKKRLSREHGARSRRIRPAWQRSHDLVLCALKETDRGLPSAISGAIRPVASGGHLGWEMEYLPEACTKRLTALLDEILALLFTLIRRLNGANRT